IHQMRLLCPPAGVGRKYASHRHALRLTIEPVLHSLAPLDVVGRVAVGILVRVLILIHFVEVEGVGISRTLMHVEAQATGLVPHRTPGITETGLLKLFGEPWLNFDRHKNSVHTVSLPGHAPPPRAGRKWISLSSRTCSRSPSWLVSPSITTATPGMT